MRNIIKITLKAIATILLILNSYTNLKAQTYMGYMGKRNLVNLNFNLGMSPHPQNDGQKGLLITYLNTKLEAEIERSLNAKFSFGASVRHTKSFFSPGGFRSVFFIPIDGSSYQEFYSGEAKLNQITVGMFLKKYLKKYGGISPSGKYFQYGINYHIVTVKEKSLYYIQIDGNSYKTSVIDSVKSCNYLSVLLGFGNHKVVVWRNNSYVINTSICANLSPYYIIKSFADTENGMNTTDISPTIKKYLTEFDFVTAKIGIGYLF